MNMKSELASEYAVPRREPRLPMEVTVQLSGHEKMPGVETTFTQDVSLHGACVLSIRRWRPNDRVRLTTPAGGFSSSARVAYCKRKLGEGFAVGLEFIEPAAGAWVLTGAAARPQVEFR